MTCCVQGDVLAVSCNVEKQNFAHAFMTSVVRICENDSYLALSIGLLRGQSQNFWSGPRTLTTVKHFFVSFIVAARQSLATTKSSTKSTTHSPILPTSQRFSQR